MTVVTFCSSLITEALFVKRECFHHVLKIIQLLEITYVICNLLQNTQFEVGIMKHMGLVRACYTFSTSVCSKKSHNKVFSQRSITVRLIKYTVLTPFSSLLTWGWQAGWRTGLLQNQLLPLSTALVHPPAMCLQIFAESLTC